MVPPSNISMQTGRKLLLKDGRESDRQARGFENQPWKKQYPETACCLAFLLSTASPQVNLYLCFIFFYKFRHWKNR